MLDELKDKKKRAARDQEAAGRRRGRPTDSGRWGIVRDEVKDLLERYGGNARKKDDPGNRRTKIEIRRRRAGVQRRRLHRRRGRPRADHRRRLGQAAEGNQGPDVDAHPRGRPRARLRRRLHALAPSCSSASLGVCYSARIIDIPATTGYGEPIQKLFKLKDGEKIVAAYSADPRVLKAVQRRPQGPGRLPVQPRDRGLVRRLRAALQRRGVRRAEHEGRPQVRPAQEGRDDHARLPLHRARGPARRHRAVPGHGLQARKRSTTSPARARASCSSSSARATA